MNLNKQQINCIANKIQKNILTFRQTKKEEFISNYEFTEEELDLIDLLQEKDSHTKSIKKLNSELNNLEYVKNNHQYIYNNGADYFKEDLLSKKMTKMYPLTPLQDIIDDLIISSIDNEDINKLIDTISNKYNLND